MDMDQSIRDSLNQLVNLQMQQISALNLIASQGQSNSAPKGQQAGVYSQSAPAANFASSYANYAPVNFGPPQTPFTESTQRMHAQMNQALAAAGGAAGFFDSVFVDKSKVSTQQRQAMVAEYGGNLGTAAVAGVGTAASGLAGLGTMAAVPGLVGGTIAGFGVGAVVGGLFDIGVQQSKMHAGINKFLLNDSYKFINPNESVNERDVAGFGQKQRWEVASFGRHFASEAKISDDDTMTLMTRFTEGNLFKGVKDVETFKNKMRTLTKTVKESALMLNETFDNIASMMGELQKSGIDVKNFDYFSSKSKIVGSYTGQSGTQVLKYTTGTGQQMTQGTLMSTENITERLTEALPYTNMMYETALAKHGATNPKQSLIFNAINNVGGVNNANTVIAQTQMQALSGAGMKGIGGNFFTWNEKDKTFMYDPEKYKETMDLLQSGKANLSDLNNIGLNKIQGAGTAATSQWLRNSAAYMNNSLDQNQTTRYLKAAAVTFANNAGLNGSDMSTEELYKFAYQINDPSALTLTGNYTDVLIADNGRLARNVNAASSRESMVAAYNASSPGLKGNIRSWWSGVKANIGDVAAPITELTTGVTQRISDWYNGTKINAADLNRGAGTVTDWSSAGIKSESENLMKGLYEGTLKSIKDAQNKGYQISDEVLKAYGLDEASMNKLKNKTQQVSALNNLSKYNLPGINFLGGGGGGTVPGTPGVSVENMNRITDSILNIPMPGVITKAEAQSRVKFDIDKSKKVYDAYVTTGDIIYEIPGTAGSGIRLNNPDSMTGSARGDAVLEAYAQSTNKDYKKGDKSALIKAKASMASERATIMGYIQEYKGAKNKKDTTWFNMSTAAQTDAIGLLDIYSKGTGASNSIEKDLGMDPWSIVGINQVDYGKDLNYVKGPTRSGDEFNAKNVKVAWDVAGGYNGNPIDLFRIRMKDGVPMEYSGGSSGSFYAGETLNDARKRLLKEKAEYTRLDKTRVDEQSNLLNQIISSGGINNETDAAVTKILGEGWTPDSVKPIIDKLSGLTGEGGLDKTSKNYKNAKAALDFFQKNGGDLGVNMAATETAIKTIDAQFERGKQLGLIGVDILNTLTSGNQAEIEAFRKTFGEDAIGKKDAVGQAGLVETGIAALTKEIFAAKPKDLEKLVEKVGGKNNLILKGNIDIMMGNIGKITDPIEKKAAMRKITEEIMNASSQNLVDAATADKDKEKEKGTTLDKAVKDQEGATKETIESIKSNTSTISQLMLIFKSQTDQLSVKMGIPVVSTLAPNQKQNFSSNASNSLYPGG